MLRDIFLWPVRIFMRLIFRIKVYGTENMPQNGGCIIAANHLSFWDPVLIACFLHKRRICFLAKAELFKFPPFGFVMRNLGAVPIYRASRDAGTLMLAINHLKKGNVLGIFPEGTRIRNGKKSVAKRGTIKMAKAANAAVVPVCINATYKLFSKVTMTVGEPITYNGDYTEEELSEKSRELMDGIYALGEGTAENK